MENNYIVPTSSIKIDSTSKGLATITVHVYTGSKDEDLEVIRRQAVEQFKHTIADLKQIAYDDIQSVHTVFTDQ